MRSTGTLTRIDGVRTVTVAAGITEGVQADVVRQEVIAGLDEMNLDERGISWKMAGEDEEQAAASAFLGKAFMAALFLIFIVLLAQFNRFLSVGLVLVAVVMSTIGVFLGLMIMGQPFGVVMSGIGVIALAGIVVNNNIVLIDTYDHLRREEGMDKLEAILQTCRERARPVVLTALTAILGVLPIAFGYNLELLVARDDLRRTVDPVVDLAVERDRLRTGLLDRADADRHAVDADDRDPLEGQQGEPVLRPVPAPSSRRRGRNA